MSRAPSAYSQRAKLGFRYWFTDPQSKPASPGYHDNNTLGGDSTNVSFLCREECDSGSKRHLPWNRSPKTVTLTNDCYYGDVHAPVT